MTATLKPQPIHGEDDRCYRRGCRREECRASYRATRKRADFLRERHGINHLIETRVVAAHLQRLIDSGWTRLQIAAATNVSERTIRYTLENRRPGVRRSNAEKLLALKPLTQQPRVNSTGAIRRIQALASIGWPIEDTARQAGISPHHAFDILAGHVPAVLRPTADSIATIYRQRCATPGPSAYARAIARRNRWHGPLAWHDIDNPAEQPEQAPQVEQPIDRIELAALRRNEIQHLASFGIPDHDIAERIGVTPNYVHAQLTGSRRPGWRKQKQGAAA